MVVNEIAAYESNGCEWIELYNTGPAGESLDGWRFWEQGVNHGLSISVMSSQGDWMIDPGEYAIIAQNDEQLFSGSCGEYSVPGGTVFDSSWGSLNESGELIGLKEASGMLVEEFSYLTAPNFSLERVNTDISLYTAENWHEHPDGNTFGRSNSLKVVSTDAQDTGETLPPPAISLPTTGRVMINEFLPHPNIGESEWVELYNASDFSVDISGWTLRDGVNEMNALTEQIGAHEFLVVSWTGSKLNNSGDAVVLLQSGGLVADRVSFGDWSDGEDATISDNAPKPVQGNAVGRLFDGFDTDNDSGNFAETTRSTRGQKNIIIEPASFAPPPPAIAEQPPISDDSLQVTTVVGPLPANDSQSIQPAPPADTALLSLVVITEFLPSPSGDDAKNEFIELFNPLTKPIDISGAQVDDAEGGSSPFIFPSGTRLDPGEYAVFWSLETHLSLHNDADMVRFLDPAGRALREVAYEKAKEGFSYARRSHGEWEWVAESTPGSDTMFQDLKESESGEALEVASTQGAMTTIDGIVSVPPGVFGVQYFYITDEHNEGGVQVYLHNKAFPELSLGTRVRVTGVMGEAYGEKRFNAKQTGNIEVIDTDGVLSPRQISFSDDITSFAGALVFVEGEITELKSTHLYLDHDAGEIKVVFKKGARIDTRQLSLGNRARVTGLLLKKGDKYELAPRSGEDIFIVDGGVDEAASLEEFDGHRSSYVTAGATGIGSFILGLLARARGAFLKSGLRRLAGVAMAVVRKKVPPA